MCHCVVSYRIVHCHARTTDSDLTTTDGDTRADQHARAADSDADRHAGATNTHADTTDGHTAASHRYCVRLRL